MRFDNLARRSLLVVAAALLAGCAAAPITGERQITGQEGAVVIKLITNTRSATDPAETLSSILLKRQLTAGVKETAADTVTLVRTRSTTHTTAVFSGMVAPGVYSLQMAQGAAGNMIYSFPLANSLTPFEVRAGEVSLVGTVLVQPLEGQRFVIGYVPPDAELSATFEQLFPALARQTQGKPVHTLQPSAALERRMQIARELPAVINNQWQGERGGIYIGGKIGKLLWRPAGQATWQRADVGTRREVLALRPYRGGLIAAGEEGLLRHSVDGGRQWTDLKAPAVGMILAVEPLRNGKLLAVVRRDTQWTAWITDDALAGAWRSLGAFDDERSINVPWQKSQTLNLGNQLVLAMPNGTLVFIDGDSGTISKRGTGKSLLSLSALPDGTLIAQSVIMTRTTLMSTDQGRSWSDLGTGRFVTAIAFADRQTAYAVAPVAPGVFPGDYALMASRDGARTWQRVGELPGGGTTPGRVRELLIDRADASLVALLHDGTVLRSTDEGKTWRREG